MTNAYLLFYPFSQMSVFEASLLSSRDTNNYYNYLNYHNFYNYHKKRKSKSQINQNVSAERRQRCLPVEYKI